MTRALALFALLVQASSAWSATGCEALSGTITPNVSWPQVWQALNQQTNCTDNCHLGNSPAGGLSLTSLNISVYFLVEQDSNQLSGLRLVDPGNPRASLLFQKINCTSPDVGNRMPPGGRLSSELQALIYDWIAQGAYGENPKDPIQRDFIFRDGTESLR